MDSRAVEESATADIGTIDLSEFLACANLIGCRGCEIFRSGSSKMIILVQINKTENCAAQTRSALNDGLECRLGIRR